MSVLPEGSREGCGILSVLSRDLRFDESPPERDRNGHSLGRSLLADIVLRELRGRPGNEENQQAS